MARRKRCPGLPKTPVQALALSAFASVLLVALCTWNAVRYDMAPIDTLTLRTNDEHGFSIRAHRHLVMVPFLGFVALGGLVLAVRLRGRGRE